MRNRILCICSILMIFSSAVLADEYDGGRDWASLSEVENAWDGQKMIKNSDYEAVVKELEKRKNAKKIKQDKKAGEMLMKNVDVSETDFLTKFEEQYPLLNLTVPIKIGDKEIPVGHYKVVGVKTNGRIYLNLCQSYEVVGKLQATETEDDFGSDEINSVVIEDIGNRTLLIKYCSMKFNAYAYTHY